MSKYGYQKVTFADPIKETCRCIFGFDDEQLYGTRKEVIDTTWNITPRKAFQFVGTDLFRNHFGECCPDVGENIWVTVVRNKIRRELELYPTKKFVISDIRYQNELDCVKQLNGSIIKLTRESSHVDTHASEMYLDQLVADYNYDNNRDKKSMYDYIDRLLSLD